MPELQFGYFDFKGRGQVSRLLLAYTNTQFKEKQYGFSRMSEWVQDKQNLCFDFPSLPYLIDGKLKLTQSRVIQKYIIMRANKSNLLGKNNKQKARIDNIVEILKDIFNHIVSLYYSSNFQESRKNTLESISAKLNYLNENIGSGNHFLNRITYSDFYLAVVFDYIIFFFPCQYSNWSNLDRVVSYLNSLDQIKKYYSKPQSIKSHLAPQHSRQPKFINLQAINLNTQITNSINEQIKTSSAILKIEQKETGNLQSSQKNFETVEENPVSSIKNEKSTELQRQSVQEIQQSPGVKKQFSARVQEYMKAAQAANKKGTNQKKSTLQKPLITASNIQSLKRVNSQAVWKINQQTLEEVSNTVFDQNKIYLGYWAIRGLGQVQRHLLQYCQIQFQEKLYLTQPEWFNGDKVNLSLPFPNLPYLIAGNIKFTESLAIDRYIIRISNQKQLLGRNLKDQTYVENFIKILSDLFNEIRVLCFTEDPQKKQATKLFEKHKSNLQRIKEFISDKSYSFGYLTWADFYIAEISYYIEKIYPETYPVYSFFQNIRESLENDQNVKNYYSRKILIKGPFMPPSAKIAF